LAFVPNKLKSECLIDAFVEENPHLALSQERLFGLF
jgi:hypothetical protein